MSPTAVLLASQALSAKDRRHRDCHQLKCKLLNNNFHLQGRTNTGEVAVEPIAYKEDVIDFQ